MLFCVGEMHTFVTYKMVRLVIVTRPINLKSCFKEFPERTQAAARRMLLVWIRFPLALTLSAEEDHVYLWPTEQLKRRTRTPPLYSCCVERVAVHPSMKQHGGSSCMSCATLMITFSQPTETAGGVNVWNLAKPVKASRIKYIIKTVLKQFYAITI